MKTNCTSQNQENIKYKRVNKMICPNDGMMMSEYMIKPKRNREGKIILICDLCGCEIK